jgi:hypothetical protein
MAVSELTNSMALSRSSRIERGMVSKHSDANEGHQVNTHSTACAKLYAIHKAAGEKAHTHLFYTPASTRSHLLRPLARHMRLGMMCPHTEGDGCSEACYDRLNESEPQCRPVAKLGSSLVHRHHSDAVRP